MLCNKLPLPDLQMAYDYPRISVSHEFECVRVSQGCKPVVCQDYISPLAGIRPELLVNSSVCCRLWIIRSRLTCLTVVSLHLLTSNGCVHYFLTSGVFPQRRSCWQLASLRVSNGSKEDNKGGRTLSLLLSLSLRSKILFHYS